jgi:hypothetical protein
VCSRGPSGRQATCTAKRLVSPVEGAVKPTRYMRGSSHRGCNTQTLSDCMQPNRRDGLGKYQGPAPDSIVIWRYVHWVMQHRCLRCDARFESGYLRYRGVMSMASMAASKTARAGSSPAAPASDDVRGKIVENTESCEGSRLLLRASVRFRSSSLFCPIVYSVGHLSLKQVSEVRILDGQLIGGSFSG